MTASSLPIEGYIPGTDTRVNLLDITDTPQHSTESKKTPVHAGDVRIRGRFLAEHLHRRVPTRDTPASLRRPVRLGRPVQNGAHHPGQSADRPLEPPRGHHRRRRRTVRRSRRREQPDRTRPPHLRHPSGRLLVTLDGDSSFPDGNSRTQYELFRRIADRAGWQIDTARVDLAALSAARYITAETGDPRLLADVLAPAVVPNTGYVPAQPAPRSTSAVFDHPYDDAARLRP